MTTMRKRFSIKVGDKRWTVKLVPRRPIIKGESCDGTCCAGKRLIEIYEKLTDREMLLALNHELFHAFGWHFNEDYIDITSEQFTDAQEAFWEAVEAR